METEIQKRSDTSNSDGESTAFFGVGSITDSGRQVEFLSNPFTESQYHFTL